MKTVNRTPTDLLDDLKIFIYRLRNYDRLTLKQIAELIKKDHSTVMYHLQKYQDLSQFNVGFKNRIKNFNEETFIRKMNLKKLLNQPGRNVPISASFINSQRVGLKPIIRPLKTFDQLDENDREYVEKWLVYSAIGTTILDTGTKMLSHKGIIGKRTAVHELIEEFKRLNKHFTGNENYDKKEIGIEDFLFTFLTGNEKHQNRVIKFQESIINKHK
ncbi:hypothetical protein [Chryseobacterium sp.]|uniref:hypothetical protein n=1 Tax=Chryseobacterium sp. TaxID=1871047 RepID=UPI0024E1F3DF|nr:hypothetical protein [Chryseobacterium sp.]